jgi:hypothetical protein
MELSKSTYLIIIIVIILIIVLFLFSGKKHTRQNYTSLSPKWDTKVTKDFIINNNVFSPGPMTRGRGFLLPYSKIFASTSEGMNNVKDNVKWWLKYQSSLDPLVYETISSYCPDLQTAESIEYYNLTANAVNIIQQLRPILSNIDPKSIKNAQDVRRIVGPVCLRQLNNDLGIESVEQSRVML